MTINTEKVSIDTEIISLCRKSIESYRY